MSVPPPGTPAFANQSATTALASLTSGATTTPLPDASPSALMTISTSGHSSMMVKACGNECATRARAVGILWRSKNRFAKILLDSSLPAERLGPNTAMPASRKRSPTPAAIALSGPSTASSMRSARARVASAFPSVATISQFSPRVAVPAFPGAAKTVSIDGERASAHESASSRPPPPTTSVLIPIRRLRVVSK